MKCPVCKDITLLMADKNWIEVDYCPECRWIWLDRWELEKLMGAERDYNQNRSHSQREYDDDEDSNIQNRNHSQTKRKEWFFERFDFFD